MSARTGLASLVALSAALHGLAGAGAWAGWTLFNASTSETEAASLRIALGTRGAAAGAQRRNLSRCRTPHRRLPSRPSPRPVHVRSLRNAPLQSRSRYPARNRQSSLPPRRPPRHKP